MNQILKEYTIKDIEKILPDYRLVRIEDVNGREIVHWNNPSTDIKKHWQAAMKRFNSDFIPDDYYYICLSFSARKAKEPDRFLVRKGNPVTAMPNQPLTPPAQTQQSKSDLISISAALDYITQIANLKTEIVRLELENKQLKEECAELSAELEEAESNSGLNEGKASPTVEYLKETAPGLMALADRFFEIQDRKLSLEEKKIEKGIFNHSDEKKQVKLKIKIKTFETGSEKHLNFIRHLYNEGKENELQKELDKLEASNPEKYEQICNELNLFEDENEEN